jgi:hypothetical protein
VSSLGKGWRKTAKDGVRERSLDGIELHRVGHGRSLEFFYCRESESSNEINPGMPIL